MSIAKLTLIGFSNYDDHFFDDLTFPDGINKDDIVTNILLRGGEFEVLYASPDFMKSTFPMWSRKWAPTFEKWLEGVTAEYNPIENYDRTEDSTDNATSNNSVTASDSSTSSGSGSTTNTRSAYDSATYAPHDKADQSSSGSNTSQSSSTASGTESRATHLRVHGNIGVTTAAQMLEGHYAIAAWNLIEHITDVFLREYVIPVY